MPSAISSTTGCMGSGLLISGWRSTAPTSVQSRLNDPGNDLIGRGSVAAVHAGPDTAIEGSSRCRERAGERSEEHTSELQSLTNLVCRLLLEKKKKKPKKPKMDKKKRTTDEKR